MTNKLPVVGKRYKATDSNKLITSKNHILTCDEIFPTTVILDKAASYICWPISCFFEDFEELPEEKDETKPNIFDPKLIINGTTFFEISNEGKVLVLGRECFSDKDLENCFREFLEKNIGLAETKTKIPFDETTFKLNWESSATLRCNCGNIIKFQTKPETQSHISQLSPEVKEAMEFLRLETNLFEKVGELLDKRLINILKLHHKHLVIASKNLLNALDKQFMLKEEDKIDTRQEHLDSIKVNKTNESVDVKEEEVKEKEKSIWKPVSELPEDNCSVIIKAKGGDEEIFFGAYREDNQHFMNETMKFVYPKKLIDKYCTLTDFINDYEKLKERVRKLEEKCRKS